MRTLLAVAVLAAVAAPAAAVLVHPTAASPCGRPLQLAYEARGISLVDADGAHPRALTRDPLDEQPAWSADGRWLAFVRLREADGERGDVWVMRADGTHLRRLTRDGRALLYPWRGGRVTYLDGKNGFAAAPDGTRRSSIDDAESVYAPNGRRVAFSELVSGEVSDRVWAPDSRRIAFAWNGSNVSVVDAVTGVITPLTHWPPFDRFDAAATPSVGGWSPDGRRLTITGGEGGNVFVVDANGGGSPRQLTYYSLDSELPATTDFGFSPDGRWIAYSLYKPLAGTSWLFVISPGGGPAHLIASGAEAAWRPCR